MTSRSKHLKELRPVWQLVQDDVAYQDQKAIKLPTDVAFLRYHTIAVADSEGHRILVFDLLKKVCSVVADKDVWPNAVAVDQVGHLVITDRKTHMVKIYDVNGNCLRKWGIEEVMDRPHGVAVNSKGQIVVTDTEAHCVFIFSSEGKLLKRFGTRGSDVQQLHLPFYCCVDNQDNIIVSDNLNYSVKKFDRDGKFILRIGSGQDWGQRQLQCPYGVTTDWDDNIIVSDCETHRVFLYGPQGKFIKYLLTKNDNCKNPCGLAMGPCGHLVVTEHVADYANEHAADYANVKAFQMYELGALKHIQHTETRL